MAAGRLPLCERVPALESARLMLRPVRQSGERALVADRLTQEENAAEAVHTPRDHVRALGFAEIRPAMSAGNARARRLTEKLARRHIGRDTRKRRRAVSSRLGPQGAAA